MSPHNWPSVNQVVELKEPMNGGHLEGSSERAAFFYYEERMREGEVAGSCKNRGAFQRGFLAAGWREIFGGS